jgi:hypothetical protein
MLATVLLNPIEEFFAELKGYIKKNWPSYEEDTSRGFDTFLHRCVDIVGARKESAEGHFCHAVLSVEEYKLE